MTDASERLRELIRLLREGAVTVEEFCRDFETTYNLRVEKAQLSEPEAAAYAALFEKVIWYSPFPEERKRIPNYLGEKEILDAALSAEARLSAGSE